MFMRRSRCVSSSFCGVNAPPRVGVRLIDCAVGCARARPRHAQQICTVQPTVAQALP